MEAVRIILGQLRDMGIDLLAHLPQLTISLMIVAVTWLVARILYRIVGRLFTRFRLRPSLVELFQKLVITAIWLGGILAAAIITFPTLTPAKVLTTIGLGSIAIGFAFKDIFENFFAGVLILLREPFQLGDFIESEGIEGKVEEITIRDTYLRQTDGQRVVLPNAQLFKNPVTVRTDWSRRRVTVICGVAYGENVDQARDVIYNAVNGLDTVDPSQDVQIFAQAFGPSSIDYEVTWWTGSQPVEVRASRDKVVAAVKHALDEAGIEIPFPYRTLTFKEPLEILRRKTSGWDDNHQKPKSESAPSRSTP
ncbi:MAG: mechanosensitive ion channel family protein [Candidatus Tectomicrobia bacterium]|nr:mechanosensitive ion channel family protein [Candidatus Tectomicrobia bacterium]